MPGLMHHLVVVGAGSIGERHIRCFLAAERARVSFVETNERLRSEIAARYPTATPYASLEAALEQHVDCGVIATPAPLHIPQATQLAERGVHMLIEKPLSVGTAGIERLSELIRGKRLTAAVGYVYRAHPVLAEMRRAIASGRFGKPVQLVALSGQHFPLYRPAYRQTYYARRESGGGAIQDALTHLLDLGQWLIGPIERLVADAAHQVLDGVDVEDTVHVLARQGGALASYSLNQHQAPNEMTVTVVCDRGTARFENHFCRWRSMEVPGGDWTDEESAALERDTLFIRQAHAFLDALEGKMPPLCSLDEGLTTLRANLAILESVEQGGWRPADSSWDRT